MFTDKLTRQLTILVCLMVLTASPSLAADHTNTDEEMPIKVEDAYPIEYKGSEFEIITRFEDPEEGGSRFVFRPELSFGVFRNTELAVEGNLTTDDDEDNTAEVSLLYNFNTETLRIPAFSIRGKAEFDFDGGTDLTARGIITKSCGKNRFTLNLDYIDVGNPLPEERSDLYRIGLGWDKSMNLYTLILADIFTQESRIEGEDAETLAEIGLRYQLNPDTVLLGGIGAGLSGGSDSRNFTATAGISRSF